MLAQASLITDLEAAIRTGSRETRADCLRKITNLFLSSSDRFNDEQINLFDSVLGSLVERVETRALAELSNNLAPIPNAPPATIGRLARHDEIAVAGPVLSQSPQLDSNDLIEIATTQSQAHLRAIAGREYLESSVSDILVQRGDREVLKALAQNPEANISETGFTALVDHADEDETLAETLGHRIDIPLRLFRRLLFRAAEGLRDKLIAIVPPDAQTEIQTTQAKILKEIKAKPAIERDYNTAHRRVLFMQQKNELNSEAVLGFVRANKYEELVVALALICSVPFELIDRLMHVDRSDSLLIPCKVAGFDWPTVRSIFKNRPASRIISDKEFENIAADYKKLSKETAQRIIKFWQVRHVAKAS